MELELVSIKDSSQGCRGNGRQEWWYCLIIQIRYDYQRAEDQRESLRAEAELAGHCDHKQEESSWASQRELSLFLVK